MKLALAQQQCSGAVYMRLEDTIYIYTLHTHYSPFFFQGKNARMLDFTIPALGRS